MFYLHVGYVPRLFPNLALYSSNKKYYEQLLILFLILTLFLIGS